jgi:hypothetical protein
VAGGDKMDLFHLERDQRRGEEEAADYFMHFLNEFPE